MLYPKTNKSRIAISLNGIWKFNFVGLDYNPQKPLIDYRLIGVPASYNDLYTEKSSRDHFGKVVYEKMIEVPHSVNGKWNIRIGAGGNRAFIYVDGELKLSHNGGFLPLDFELPSDINKNKFRLTIVLDNRLDYNTFPVGEIIQKNGKDAQNTHYDFSNLIGIHRNTFLYSVPKDNIEDITISTKVFSDHSLVKYNVKTRDTNTVVTIKNPLGEVVSIANGNKNEVRITNPILWDIGQGNLYTLSVETKTDTYDEKFGIRSIEVTNTSILLNGREVYLKGFGMHEDHDTIGKGSISGLNIRDFSLFNWINANSFRTSHYPYAEEMYDLADEMGILVINEMPAVGLNFWSGTEVIHPDRVWDESVSVYKKQFDKLIARDKNHPSVIMYSIANEANTHEKNALYYFSQLFEHARSKTELPLMIVEWVGAKDNKVAQLADIIGFNRYIGWYTDFSELDVIMPKLTNEITEYHEKFNKPVLLSEFGADTIAGLHKLPSVAFSEEFQVEFIDEYRKTISKLPFVIGEHVWNFADFSTKQGLTRVDGNKKGVFTRNRQPKMIAHYLRREWKQGQN